MGWPWDLIWQIEYGRSDIGVFRARLLETSEPPLLPSHNPENKPRMEDLLVRETQVSPSNLPLTVAQEGPAELPSQSTQSWEIIGSGYLKPLRLGVFCCAVISNWYRNWYLAVGAIVAKTWNTWHCLWDWAAGERWKGSKEFISRSWKSSEEVATGGWKGVTYAA